MGKQNIKFPIGGMWEDAEWTIYIDEPVSGDLCKHCRPKNDEDAVHQYHTHICPRVVSAQNEGGYNSTGICLECILEAAAELEEGGDE